MKPAIPGRAKGLRLAAALVSGILIALLAAAVGMGFRLDAAVQDGSARVEARKSKASGAGPGSAAVQLVFIDQYSLDWVEEKLGYSWPWPRELYGIMASFLSEAEAQCYDILFTEGSSYGAEDDARCARAMDRAGNVVLALPAGISPGSGFSPLPVENVRWGSVRGLADPDGILRRYLPLSKSGEGLAAEGAADGTGDGPALPSFGLAALLGSGDADRSGRALPDFKPGAPVYLRFLGPSPSLKARNAAEILSAALDRGRSGLQPGDFSDAYVFIGFSAPGLLDRQAVPTDKAMPGAEIHATFAANVLDKALIQPISRGLAWGIGALFILAGALIPIASSSVPALSIGALAVSLGPFGLAWGLRAGGYWIDVGAVSFGGLFAYLLGIGLAYAAEGRERLFLRRSFSQYLSPQVIDKLVSQPSRLALGGEEREISILFSDIEGFTSISESMDPERLGRFMNLYLSIATDAIMAEGGTLDKYIGDAVVAFWNAPLDQEDHALRALRAALAFLGALEERSQDFRAFGIEPPRTRIGIHTGKAAVGNFGSSRRFAYTALGDAVNTASRLEEANKVTGGRVLASSQTVGSCQAFLRAGDAPTLRRLGSIIVDGKALPIEVWEPGSADSESQILPWDGIKDCRVK